jgi:hypothetical protein
MEPSTRATCQYRKEDRQLCKRSVSQGEDYCWQHAYSLRSKWKSLTRNQTVIFLATLATLLGLPITIISFLHPAPSKEEIAHEVVRNLPPPPVKREVEKEPQENLKTEDKLKVEVHRKPKQSEKHSDSPEKPDIHLALVYPKAFAIVLYNSSGVLLEKPKYAPGIWNLDRLNESGNAPTLIIPVFEGDWIRPHESMGPENVFDSPLVKPAVKPGDRLFGFITVTCPTCLVNREYWVYEVFDEGGWYCELPKGKAILLDKLAAAIPSFRVDSTFQDTLECEGGRKTIKALSETNAN